MEAINLKAHIVVEHVNCPICKMSDAVLEATAPDYDCHTCGDQEFNLMHCKFCSTFYLNPRPVQAALPIIYSSKNYYSYDFSKKGNPIVLKARLNRDLKKVSSILGLLNKPVSELKILDIGAGDASLLKAFQGGGALPKNLFGLELDQSAVMNMNSYGFNGIMSRVEDMSFPDESLDCITLIQVIEHVAYPKELIEQMYRMLKPGGILFMETPNMNSWERPLFKKNTWGGYHFPRHWTLWGPETMKKLLSDSQYEQISITTPAAAVTWVWSMNHVFQKWWGKGSLSNFFSIKNPIALAFFLFLDLLPSVLGKSANMRVVAQRKK